MSKNCIFNNSITCSDCGKCDICDLNDKKICNNCGKCLEMSGVDIRAIKIEEINDLEDSEEHAGPSIEELAIEVPVYDDDYSFESDNELYENEEPWELIDDIDGLSELMEDEKRFNTSVRELSPGLLYIDKSVRD